MLIFCKISSLKLFLMKHVRTCLTVLLLLLGFFAHSKKNDTIYVQLKWKHQFQFAGYYAAIEKGFYKEEGLEVKLLEAVNGNEAIPSVLNGEVQYGVATSDLILSRVKGEPVVVIANIFQHSPYVLLSLKHSNSDNIHDLAGKSIMMEEHAAELYAYLAEEQISKNEITFVPHSFTPNELINGEVYAISAYVTDEPFLVSKEGLEYNVFNPRSSGIDFFGDVLFTSEREINQNPERVQAFRRASIAGWKYALENEDEIIDVIYEKYSKRHSKEHLKYEAGETRRLIVPEVVEIGYVNKSRWQRIGEIYAEQNMIPAKFNLKGFVYDEHLSVFSKVFWYYLIGSLLFLLIALVIIVRFYRLNINLQKESERRKRNEQALQKLQEMYLNLTKNAPFPIIISAPDSAEIIYMNEQACHKFEISSAHVSRKKTLSFYVDTANRVDIVKKVNAQGFVKNRIVQMKSASGEKFWASVSSNLMEFKNREALFSAIIDVSDQVTQEKELRELNSYKDKFFSIIAHDLKGPIGTISAFLELISNKKEEIPKQKYNEVMGHLTETSKYTYQLLENLLLWAQSEKGEIKYKPEKQALNVVIEDIIHLYSAALCNKEIELVNHCAPDLECSFDREMLFSVLKNLVDNALKYSNPGGVIEISSETTHSEVVVCIKDNGIGMNKEELSHIFGLDRETRSTPGTKGEKGTGIGLVLTRDFVHRHGGQLTATSEKGKGSTFRFSIPVQN